MSLSQISFSPRVRAIAATSMAALGATALVAIPAAATPGCDGLAATAFELQEELQCATDHTGAEYTVTLTADFDVAAGSATVYAGTANLVIDGAGHTVTGQSGASDSPPATPFLVLGNLGGEEGPSDQLSSFDVEIRNLEATGFTEQGVITSFTTGELSLTSVRFHGNSAGDPNNVDNFLAFGGAITAIRDVTVSNSSFVDNNGLFGGAISSFPAMLVFGDFDSLPGLTIDGSHFHDNNSYAGGGAFLALGSATVTNSTFVNNTAPVGGAIATIDPLASESMLTVTGSEFSGNTADDPGEFVEIISGEHLGGAIFAGMDTVITDSTFTDHHSIDGAGTIAVTLDGTDSDSAVEPSLTMIDSEISNSSSEYWAGAILADGDLTLTRTTVANSESPESVILSGNNTAIDSSTFVGNLPGGGVTLALGTDEDGTATVTNSTFVDNIASEATGAGALALGGGTVSVTHSTFWGNDGGVAGDIALWLETGEATLYANAFADGGESPSCLLEEGSPATLHNFDADGSCTSGWTGEGDFGDGLDAHLGALADNGGATQTLLPLEDSPLIDVIPAQAGSPVVVDQRGFDRPSGDGYDIGSVEVQPAVEDENDDGDAGDPGDDAGLVAFQVKTDGGVLYGTASAAVAVTDINWTATGDLTGAPADTALPYGAAGFTIEVPEPGATVTVTLTAPAPFTSAYKVSGDTWTAIPGATFSADGTTVTYTLTDGGDLDEDGQTNGYIVDPVALAVQATFTG